MSSSFSANQYDSAFKPQRMQNWCQTKQFKERPNAKKGQTTFIANERGHLLPGVAKRGSAWPDFKGTWDLPNRVPAHRINPTARSIEGIYRLRAWGFDPEHIGKRQPQRGSKNTAGLQDAGRQTYEDTELDGRAALTAEARPESQSRPFTGDQNQYEGEDRAGSQSSATDEVPAERPAAGEGTSTGKDSPVRPSSQATPDQADKQKAQPVTFI